MIAVTDDSFSCFKRASWTDARRRENLAELRAYVQRYEAWAAGLQAQLPTIAQTYHPVVQKLLDRIVVCTQRLRAGIRMLEENDTGWHAFRFTNLDMMCQSTKKRYQPETKVACYPFQRCYVLMCLPDMVDEWSRWRETVDLLWFPTGGGKTEAYLGVAAFPIFYRRLAKGDAGSGVTVLMRYTLRMLTAQQFERAAALICECDLIRRQEALPGGEISIGLWVGGDVSPIT